MTKPMQELPMDGTPGFALSSAAVARIDALAARYPTKASALMPCLWVIRTSSAGSRPAAST